MISLLSGQIIKISGPQFWKDKKWRDVQIWNKKWCPWAGFCPSRLLSYRTIISGYFFLVPGLGLMFVLELRKKQQFMLIFSLSAHIHFYGAEQEDTN